MRFIMAVLCHIPAIPLPQQASKIAVMPSSPELPLAPAHLPQRRNLCGPVTAARLARFYATYGALLLTGLMAQLVESTQWKAFGLGLMIPGGGFLLHANLASAHGLIHLAAAA